MLSLLHCLQFVTSDQIQIHLENNSVFRLIDCWMNNQIGLCLCKSLSNKFPNLLSKGGWNNLIHKKMASKQMEAIQKKLGMLNYPRANASAQSLLFAGMERYALFEWLFFRYLLFSVIKIHSDFVAAYEQGLKSQLCCVFYILQ